jgi:predicted esterase
VPTSGYDRPIFIGQGLDDRQVSAPLTAKLVADLILGGTDLTPRVYPHGHSETMADSLPDSSPFVHRLLEG